MFPDVGAIGARGQRHMNYETSAASSGNWRDVPSSLHNGACGFAFADGHSEVHKWKTASLTQMSRGVDYDYKCQVIPIGNDKSDWKWWAERSGEPVSK